MSDEPKSSYTTLHGVFDLGEGLNPIEVWQGLHASAPLWIASAGIEGGQSNRDRIDETDLSLIRSLSKLPADRWQMICEGVGWTAYGAAALSWCEGAKLADVLDGFNKAVGSSKPNEEELRPARFVNPNLLTVTSLTEIIQMGSNYNRVWFYLAACKGHRIKITQDLEPQKLEQFTSGLKVLLD